MHVCEAVEITKSDKAPEMVDANTEDGMLGSDVANSIGTQIYQPSSWTLLPN